MRDQNTPLLLAKQSWNVLKKQKKLSVFMAFSTVFSLLILFTALHFLAKLETSLFAQNHPLTITTTFIFLAGLLLFFMLLNTIALVFSAGFMKCAIAFLEKKPYSLSMGFKVVFSHFWRLYVWHLVGNTFGACVRFLAYWVDHWNQSAFAKNLLSGLPWSVATQFVPPILTEERCGTHAAIKESAKLIHNTWGTEGKTLNLNIGLGGKIILLRFLLLAPLIAVLLINHGVENTPLLITTVISMLVLVVFNTIMLSCDLLTLTAVYLFSKKRDLLPYYDMDLLKQAFRPVQRKAWE